MANGERRLFALATGRAFGEEVAAALGTELDPHEEREFEFGQHKSRPLVSVRGCDVFVVQSLHGDTTLSANDKLCRLLFFIGALKDAAASNVTAVVPFLCYSRKDAKTKNRDPVITRYVAGMFEAVGTDCVATIDVHNLAAFQNSFRCRTEHLEARSLFADSIASRIRGLPLTIVSPDSGGIKRAEALRRSLESKLGASVESALAMKQRSEGRVTGGDVVGDVDGRVAVIVDDMISSGTTLRLAALACRRKGAVQVHAFATHGVFTPEAAANLADAAIDCVSVLDTIPIPPFMAAAPIASLVPIRAAAFVADAVRRLHGGESLVEL